MNNKPTEIEIPKNVSVSDAIFRLVLEDINKTIKNARAISKERITVTIKKGE